MESPRTGRIAFAGLPGAGKSTSATILRDLLGDLGRTVETVKVAAPLYDVQRHFYARIGFDQTDGHQDGRLLNFLGSHFREVSPDFLHADFAQRCTAALCAGTDVVICDDARPADLDGLAKLGFSVVHVTAPESIRRERKAKRADLVAGNDAHPTEAGEVVGDHQLDNSGDLTSLRAAVSALIAELAWETTPALDDDRLIEMLTQRAERAITPLYVENRHQIGAVLLATDGRIFTGIHLEAMVGRASICAEAIALGKACEAGATGLRAAVAVRHPKPSEADQRTRIVPPCGLCRELLLDYSPNIRVIVADSGTRQLLMLGDLLPHKYVGTKWRGER
jgi:cytidine deaminase